MRALQNPIPRPDIDQADFNINYLNFPGKQLSIILYLGHDENGVISPASSQEVLIEEADFDAIFEPTPEETKKLGEEITDRIWTILQSKGLVVLK